MLPKLVIKEYSGIHVVRDDLLEGGTKRRLFTDYIKYFPKDNEFVNAPPKEDYGDIDNNSSKIFNGK